MSNCEAFRSTVGCCCPQLWPPGVSDVGLSWCWTGTLLYPVSLLFGCWDRWSAQKLTIPRSSDWWLKCWRTGWALELWSLKCWPPDHGWKIRKGRKAGFLLTKEKYLTGRYVAVWFDKSSFTALLNIMGQGGKLWNVLLSKAVWLLVLLNKEFAPERLFETLCQRLCMSHFWKCLSLSKEFSRQSDQGS